MRVSSRVLLLVFLVPAAAITFGAGAMYSAIVELERASDATQHSGQVIAGMQELLRLAVDAETGERGFVIAGETSFLEPYEHALGGYEGQIARLGALLSAQPAQLERLVRVHAIFDEWRRTVELRVIGPIRRTGDVAAARTFESSGEGKRLVDSLRAVSAELIAEEQRLLARRALDEARARQRAAEGALGTGAGVLCGVLLALFVVVQFVRQTRGLAATASALAAGYLGARAHVPAAGEIAQLASTLNLLAERLAQRTSEAQLLERLREGLHACQDPVEIDRVLARIAPHVFERGAGGVYLINPSRDLLGRQTGWGGELTDCFGMSDCWALRRGQPYLYEGPGATTLACPHADERVPAVCVPLSAGSDTLGVLHQQVAPGTTLDGSLGRRALAVGETLALSVANLRLRESLRNQAIRDALTGLFNRRYMEETLTRELVRAKRQHQPLAVVIFDVDHFKRYNDTHGHSGGDALLRALGGLTAATFRASDVVCRYGGEEFVAILPESPLAGALTRAEALRVAVHQLAVSSHGETLGPVTISIGVAAFPQDGASSDTLLAAADAALYRSKREGRDRTTVAGAPPTPAAGSG